MLVIVYQYESYNFTKLNCVNYEIHMHSLHLFVLSLHRDCPEECKEAVASLIYAAARFADLPELRELRAMFTEKYGNSLESFTSKEVNSCAL